MGWRGIPSQTLKSTKLICGDNFIKYRPMTRRLFRRGANAVGRFDRVFSPIIFDFRIVVKHNVKE